MSQYAYVPISAVSKIKESYRIATPLTWTFQKDGNNYGGLEDNEFNNAQKDDIIALGGAWFPNANVFLDWTNE